jgi:hypothetical protein
VICGFSPRLREAFETPAKTENFYAFAEKRKFLDHESVSGFSF